MAISLLPVDGLINRLIQQNQRSTSASSSSAGRGEVPRDRVNISSQAKAHAGSSTREHAPSQLESKLLEMYKARNGGRS